MHGATNPAVNVAMAAPLIPKPGKPNIPKIKIQSRIIFKTFTVMPIIIGVIASPFALNTALREINV